MSDEISIDTPFDDAISRKQQIALLRLVIDCEDGDFIRALTQFAKRPEIGVLIEAKRQGIFDYGALLLDTSAGKRWPAAHQVMAAIEKAMSADGLTHDSPEWDAIVKSIGLDGSTTTRNGQKITSSEQLFELVTGQAVAKKTETAKKVEPKPKAEKKVEPKAEKVVSSQPPEEKGKPITPAETEALVTGASIDDITALFEILDEQMSEKIQNVHERMDTQNINLMKIMNLQSCLLELMLMIYKRQEQLDLFVDPAAEFPVLSKQEEQNILDILSGAAYADPSEDVEPEQVQPKTVVKKPDLKVVQREEEEPNDASVAIDENKSDEDGEDTIIELTESMKDLSDTEFDEMLSGADDVIIENSAVLRQLNVEKLRSLAGRVGVGGAASLNHKGMLIERIRRALSPE